jgi:hypothetical protein
MDIETANNSLNMNVFTNVTKKVCMCSFISMVLIMLFIISPLSYFVKTSVFAKIIIVVLLCYTVYLNNMQTNSLKSANLTDKPQDVISQYNMNIMCSYVFTFFLILLTFFVIKSFF